MKCCKKCGVQHNKKGDFCSRACANSRTFSDETKLKIGNSLKGRKYPNKIQINEEQRILKCKKTWELKYKNTKFDDLGFDNKRRRVIEEQNYCCIKCGISEWFGIKIILEIDHKDGINDNNKRENLEALCPNCHSLTDTWRGRNKSNINGVVKVSDQELLDYLKTSKSIREGLLKSGLAAKGKNYIRAKKLLTMDR